MCIRDRFMSMKMPKGKYIATVKVGEKGQIVIPKGARELFGIEPGDTLLLLSLIHILCRVESLSEIPCILYFFPL